MFNNDPSYFGVSGPNFTKSFLPATIGSGSVSTLTFNIINGSSSPVTDLAFTDNLPTGMTISKPAHVINECDGVITAPDGGGTISLVDGRVEGSTTCQIFVNVTGLTPGVHTNTTSALSSSESANGAVATANLTVVTTLPGFSKSFAPDSVFLGERSILTFTIDNTGNASVIGDLNFIDNLPEGLMVADPSNATTDCISASAPDTTITAVAGTSTIILDANGSTLFPGFEVLSDGATCTVTVDVITTGIGTLENVSNDLLADFTSSGKATDSIDVTSTELHLVKSFTDDPIPPGGTATLEFNVQNFNRNYSATEVAFTDDLTALVPAMPGISFSSLVSNDCGGSVSGVGGTIIGLSDGILAPGAACTIRVSINIPSGSTLGGYLNKTSAITGTINGSPVVGNMASEILFVEPVPILTKEFLEVGTFTSDPVVNPGDDVILRFTISNTSTTSGATDVTFSDELTDGGPNTGFLPFPITNAPFPIDPCGAGSTIAYIFPDIERQGIQLSGGALAVAGMAGDSCTFDIQLTIPDTMPPAVYSNTTQAVMATVDGATRIGDTASDTLTIVSAPTLNKEFTDDPVPPGGTVTMEFTVSYPDDANGNATDISFTDDLAPVLTGLTANLPANPDPPCGVGSSLTGSAGDTLLTLVGGTLTPGGSCTFTVTLDIPLGTAPGNFTNTTSDVSATVEGFGTVSASASDVLNVTGVVFTKEFLGDPVIAGDAVTLRFDLENIHPSDDATGMSFIDNLASTLPGLSIMTALPISTCGGTLSNAGALLIFTGGSLSVGESCHFEIDLLVPVGAADGAYPNITSSLTATQGGVVVMDPAVDNLIVDSNKLDLAQSFTNDPVAPGESVTIEFTITNLDATRSASDIDFTDDLDAALSGLIFDSVLNNTCGGTVTGQTTTMIDVSGASLSASGACTLAVSLTVPSTATAGIYPNTTSSLTGTIAGFDVTGDPASDDLEVLQLLAFSKSFDGSITPGGTVTLTFSITNPGTDTAVNLAFSDDLDSVVTGLTAVTFPTNPCGEGSSVSGSSLLTFTGGELVAMGGTCTFEVEVLVPNSASAGTYPNVTSELFQNGLKVADPATADLTIDPPVYTFTYFPMMVFEYYVLPDLVITSLTASGTDITVVIENQGNTTSTDDFWVDIYFNPSQTPELNEAWQSIAPAGVVWGVTQELLPGQSLTLTVGDEYYHAGFSSSSFPTTGTVYGFVDSIDLTTTYGAVEELDEDNNLFGPSSYAEIE